MKAQPCRQRPATRTRRRGHTPQDAQDLTQGFFERFLELKSIANADPQRGRFRSFMLGALNHFLMDERARANARKRGARLAVFDVLLFPLLALDYAILMLGITLSLPPELRLHPIRLAEELFEEVLRLNFAAPWGQIMMTALFWIALVLVVNWLICRRVWRAVNQALLDSEGPAGGSPSDGSQTRLSFVALILAG